MHRDRGVVGQNGRLPSRLLLGADVLVSPGDARETVQHGPSDPAA